MNLQPLIELALSILAVLGFTLLGVGVLVFFFLFLLIIKGLVAVFSEDQA